MDAINRKFRELQHYIVTKGIAVPFVRDENKPSVSLTLLLISFLLWVVAVTKAIPDMDISKIENMVMITAGLYFSRKVSKGSKTELIQQTEQGEK